MTAHEHGAGPRAMLPAGTFAGKTALITGGGSGLGLAMSIAFAQLGAKVIIASTNPARRAAGVEAVRATGAEALEIELDVRRHASIENAFREAIDWAGDVDVLVNNAAANFFAPAEKISLNGWSTIVDRVLQGTFFCSQAFARARLSRGQPGSIVNIGAVMAITGGAGVAPAAAAKAGVLSLTKSLALEWARDGIRVNALLPGVVPHGDDDVKTSGGRVHFAEAIGRRIPVGRPGRPEEIAWLATYLASPFADFVTGQAFIADGGSSLHSPLDSHDFVPIRDRIS